MSNISLEAARELVKAGRAAEALAAVDALLAVQPGFAGAQFTRGHALMGLSRWAEAIPSFSSALGQEGCPPEAWYNLGMCRGRLGEHAAAVTDFSRFLGLRPKDVDAHLQRANRRLDAAEYAGAADDYEKAIALDAAMEKELRSWAELARRFDRLLREGPAAELAAACRERGWAKLGGQDARTAATWFSRTVEADPGDAEGWRGRAEARSTLGQKAEALQDAAKAAELAPASPEAWRSLGNVRRDGGDIPAALEAYARAIELKRDEPVVWFARGLARGDAGDLAGADEDYTQALALKPDYGHALLNRGWARRKLSRHAEAVADLTRCLDLDGRNALAYSNRGYARQGLGDLEGMRQDFRKAVELNPSYEAELRPLIGEPAPAPLPAKPVVAPPPPPPEGCSPVLLGVVAGLLVLLGVARVPYLSAIPSRICDIPFKVWVVFSGSAEGEPLSWRSDLCAEPFCRKIATRELHVWGKPRYTSQVDWWYCGEHEPYFASTYSRIDAMIFMLPYWALVYAGYGILGVAVIPLLLRILMWPVLVPAALAGRQPWRILLPGGKAGWAERLDSFSVIATAILLVGAAVLYWWY